jgi:AAA domain/Bifunctional DNA primase/polymerase, N-terminal
MSLDTALSYIARGWNPVPIPHRTKAPRGNEWQRRRIDAETASQFFNGAPSNIGVQLGTASGGLTDIDLDCSEAITVAPYILPKTGAIFGRPSKRASHHLYKTDLADRMDCATIPLKDPGGQQVLLEVRIGGGGKGAQTVFPGSTHECGEAITWEENGEAAAIDGEELLTGACLVAACALIARYWPAQGSRHDAARVLGGFLSRAGKTAIQVRLYTEAIAKAAEDPEWRDRRKTAEDAATAYRSDKRAYGLPAMQSMFGRDVANKIAEWLDYRSDNERAEEAAPIPDGQLIKSSTEFVKGFVPPDYLVDGLLQRRYCYALTARTGDGKTALALLLAACVDQGIPFGGHPTERGRVLFFAGENPDDIRARWIAMSVAMNFDIDKSNVHFIPGAFKISGLIVRITKEVQALGGVSLIIVDTSAAFYEGAEENDNVQQGAHARRLRGLVNLSGGPCVIVNCHPVKNASDDNLNPRGGGAFVAEIDGNLTALRDDTAVTLHCR